MISQSIVAVVLPAGPGAAGKLRANLYLTPRLAGARLLSDFPDWLEWTDLVHRHGLQFTLSSGGRTAVVAADTAPLRPDIWSNVFGHDSVVRAYPAPGFDRRLVVSYPSRDAHDFLRYAYQRASAMLGTDEQERTLSALLEDLVFRAEDGSSDLGETLSRLRVDMWKAQQPGVVPGTGATGSPDTGPPDTGPPDTGPPDTGTSSTPGLAARGGARALLVKPPGTRAMAERFALYHHLPAAPNRPALPHRPHELAHLIDFHQALTALTGYPRLLPALGLVFPVDLPETLCPASPASGTYLTVQVTAVHPGWVWTHPPTLAGPATSYARRARHFAAAPATAPAALATGGSIEPADIVDGFLALTPADFHLVGVDLDGAMLKAMALADSLANSPERSLSDGTLPALRSSGVSLLADNRAQQLLQAIRDNTGFEAALSGGKARPLNGRDLTRGFRIDIYSDRSRQWQSLHRRDGTYRFGGDLVVHTDDEEGFTQLAVVQPAEDPSRPDDPMATAGGVPQAGTDLYVNERIARWNGWGLSAPRPGTPLNRSPDPAHATDDDPTRGRSFTAFNLASSFSAHPGTLPSLRFGARYRLRARAVDLAGQSLPLAAPAPDGLVAPAGGQLLPYYRYEPVGPPVVVLRTSPGPGGSLHQLVIRSHNTDPSLDTVPVVDADERHVAPPRAAVLMVEHHGLLDDAAGLLRGDAETYALVTARDRGQIPTVGDDPIQPGPRLAVPYLADPIARGAALTDLPQTAVNTDGTVSNGVLSYVVVPGVQPRAGSMTHLPFGVAWPEREAFRVRLVEGEEAPSWDDANRVLTVSLRKGKVASTALSCHTSAVDLDLLGVWNWMRELFEAADAAALDDAGAGPELVAIAADRTRLTRLALDGSNELITPSVPISFTHAVQQPLGRPTWSRLPIVHDPAAPLVAESLSNSFSPLTAWRSLGSHHTVLLGVLEISGATTAAIDLEARWIDWIDDVSEPAPTQQRSSSHVDRINLTDLAGGALAADGTGTRQVAVYIPHIDALWFAAPFDQLAGVPSPSEVAAPVHQLGDTKHRTVRYRAVASSRFQEHFPEPGTVTTRIGPGVTVDVPSSARPLTPDVSYVLPTFGWDRQTTTNTKTEVRAGNGLRVYLNRPWYSSGSDELLGVVLWPAAAPAPTDDQREANKAIITQWGLDPIWASGPLSPVPTTGDFPGALRSGNGLTLHQTPQLVDVAGHQVFFDPSRQLWYCDIELVNPTAYAPFVRLALARYQPRSIAGVELSNVALADFTQLSPNRSAALTVDPADPQRARLVVAGLAPGSPGRSYVTATVEVRRPDVAGDLGWQVASPAQVRVLEDTPVPEQPESILLAATVRFAAPVPPGQFRLVVREFEVLPIDSVLAVAGDDPDFGSRLVYASILPFDYPLRVGPA